MTSAHSLLDWINTTNKEASDHQLLPTLTMTNTHKRTASTHTFLWWRIDPSLTESLASDVECVTLWQETHCFIMENGAGKRRLLSFKSISHTWACELRLGRWWYVCHRKWSAESENGLFSQLQDSDDAREGECDVSNSPQDDTVGHTQYLIVVHQYCAADTETRVLSSATIQIKSRFSLPWHGFSKSKQHLLWSYRHYIRFMKAKWG